MDMAFISRAERLLAEERPARLDHSILVATLAASRCAQAQESIRVRIAAAPAAGGSEDDLVELLLCGPRWRQALSAQQGCFSRAVAGRRINAP